MLEHAHRVQAQLPYMDLKAVNEFWINVVRKEILESPIPEELIRKLTQ